MFSYHQIVLEVNIRSKEWGKFMYTQCKRNNRKRP